MTLQSTFLGEPITIEVVVCKNDPRNNECPRCWHWHKNDGPVLGEREILCWRCQKVLLEEHPNHPVTEITKRWRDNFL